MSRNKFLTIAMCIALLFSMLAACSETVVENDEKDPPIVENNEDVSSENDTNEEEAVGLIDYNDLKWYDDALLINYDPNWYWVSDGISTESVEAAEESARKIAEAYLGHSITDVLFCIFEQTSIIPSEYQMWRGSKYLMTEENGIPVDYSSDVRVSKLYKVYEELGVDPVKIILDTLRENGIRPWINLRMNDVHFGSDETAFLRSDYYYEAKEKGYMVCSNGEDYGYYNTALDYSVSEVRENMLNYIEEVLGKYDMFGIELDFMREMYSFDYINNPDCCSIMNDFIREVNKLVEAAEQKWGHDIKIMVRTARSIEATTVFGFDVTTWVNEDLVDALVPSPRWAVADSGIPVSEWVDLVGDKDIAIFPCTEYLGLDYTLTTSDISKAYAASWYGQGADGFYAYNHMVVDEFQIEVWDFNREYCIDSERRFVVTYQDISPEGLDPYEPLPIAVSVMNKNQTPISLDLGNINPDDTVILTFGLAGKPEKINISKITVNGLEPNSVENMGLGYIKAIAEDRSGDILLSDGYAYVCTFTGLDTDGAVDLFFESDKYGVVDYIEFKIIPSK